MTAGDCVLFDGPYRAEPVAPSVTARVNALVSEKDAVREAQAEIGSVLADQAFEMAVHLAVIAPVIGLPQCRRWWPLWRRPQRLWSVVSSDRVLRSVEQDTGSGDFLVRDVFVDAAGTIYLQSPSAFGVPRAWSGADGGGGKAAFVASIMRRCLSEAEDAARLARTHIAEQRSLSMHLARELADRALMPSSTGTLSSGS
jgi:hypothetical protein